MTLNNVTIGDKFIASNDTRSKRVSVVIDFLEAVSLVTGKRTGQFTCIAEKEFMGQVHIFETPFSTVVRNRIK